MIASNSTQTSQTSCPLNCASANKGENDISGFVNALFVAETNLSTSQNGGAPLFVVCNFKNSDIVAFKLDECKTSLVMHKRSFQEHSSKTRPLTLFERTALGNISLENGIINASLFPNTKLMIGEDNAARFMDTGHTLVGVFVAGKDNASGQMRVVAVARTDDGTLTEVAYSISV